MAELETLEFKYPSLITSDSPTQFVGAGSHANAAFRNDNAGLVVSRHDSPMLSLRNISSRQELQDFDTQVHKLVLAAQTTNSEYLQQLLIRYCLELKYDGMAISLVFRRGRLIKALTRGDGVSGEIISLQALNCIVNLPTTEEILQRVKTLNGENGGNGGIIASAELLAGNFELRGELLMTKKAFMAFNQHAQHSFSSCRNLVAGFTRRKQSSSSSSSITTSSSLLSSSSVSTEKSLHTTNTIPTQPIQSSQEQPDPEPELRVLAYSLLLCEDVSMVPVTEPREIQSDQAEQTEQEDSDPEAKSEALTPPLIPSLSTHSARVAALKHLGFETDPGITCHANPAEVYDRIEQVELQRHSLPYVKQTLLNS